MEGFLFSLDVFFMLILVLGVVRRYKKKLPARDLGFFMYAVRKGKRAGVERGENSA